MFLESLIKKYEDNTGADLRVEIKSNDRNFLED